MKFKDFDSLIGQNSYVRCEGKKRIDPSIVNNQQALDHISQGGQIGWWVRQGYIIVDIDEGKDVALKIIRKLKLNTLMCKTPKGLHLYFKTDETFPQKVGMVLPFGLKCDYRCAEKGYVVLPFGSSGRAFNNTKTIAELPREFTPLMGCKESLLNLSEGEGRNSTLFTHLMAYKNRGASEDELDEMAELINTYVFKDPMDEDELAKIVDNTKRYKATEGFTNPYVIYTDKGKPSQINSRAVCDYFVNEGKAFVLGSDCYRYQDGVYVEASSHVRNTIKNMVEFDNLIQQSKLMECYRLLADDARIQKSAQDLNSHTNLINFKNGVWDINKKKLLPHDSKYLQTIQIPHEVKKRVPFKNTYMYDFLVNQAKLSKSEVGMLLDYVAYCMTTNYGLKTFMILVGRSNTGKSVLIRFIENLVGKVNTSALAMHELNARFYPSQLYGKLLNSCADNKSLPLTSIENLKKITGGDQIMHEKKGKEPFFFTSFAKLLFSFNQLPLQLEEKSDAFYKRMRVLKMDKELFLNDEYVNRLCSDESIEQLIPTLLNRLPLKKIPRTDTSNQLVELLRQDSDTIHAFITTRCTESSGKRVSKSKLYQAYVEFCINTGREAHKSHSFARLMRARYKEVRSKNREYCWEGVELNKEDED